MIGDYKAVYEKLLKDIDDLSMKTKKLELSAEEKQNEISMLDGIIKDRKAEIERLVEILRTKADDEAKELARIRQQEIDRLTAKESAIDIKIKDFDNLRQTVKDEELRLRENNNTIEAQIKSLEAKLEETRLAKIKADKNVEESELILNETRKKDAEIKNKLDEIERNSKLLNEEIDRNVALELANNEREKDLEAREKALDQKNKAYLVDMAGIEKQRADLEKLASDLSQREIEQITKDKNLKDKEENLNNLKEEIEFGMAKLKKDIEDAKKKGIIS